MRRDILELDTAVREQRPRRPVSAEDAEAIRLILTGGSVIDWSSAIFNDLEAVDRFLGLHYLDASEGIDQERLAYVYNEAVAYIESQLNLRVPKELRNPSDVRTVFVDASLSGMFSRKRILSCAILKIMHVIHHMEAADLKFRASVSEAELFDRAERRLMRGGIDLQKSGLPVVAFYGSRKTRASVISKLISKRENIASTVFDKLRFRIIVEKKRDLAPTMAWLTRNLVPFNYVIPGESHNNLIDGRNIQEAADSESVASRGEQIPVQVATSKNQFSGSSYQMINFVADFPVKLDSAELSDRFRFELGSVVYVMVEFQLLDEKTAQQNEVGANAHHRYKQRQKGVIAERLGRRGVKDSKGDS